MSRQGKRLRSGEKDIIMNVRAFFETEKRKGKSILRNSVIDRTAKATKIGKTTIKAISREYRGKSDFESPAKRYENNRVRINPDEFDRAALRRTIHDFYSYKEYPTLDKLLQKVHDKSIFSGGRSTLAKVLKSMGFRYKTREDGKRYVYEQPRVIQQRHEYLRRMRRNRVEKRPEVFLDETWLNSHAAPEKLWVDCDGSGGWRRPSGKGQRLIILHAGSREGWVPESELVFRSKTRSEDYHDEMNTQHFMEWFEQSLIPQLPPQSLIILDNAKYHNAVVEKVPTKSSTKAVMKEWLDKHNIAYDATDLKRDLFSKISAVNAKTVYRTDEVAHRFGHEVVRLPIAHCEFNPIELAWSVVKRHCRTQNKSFTLKEIEDLVPNGFEQVTPAMWSNFCDHVKKVEDEYWEKDGLIEDALEEFVIRLSESDFDSSTDDNDTDTDSDTPSDDEHDVALQREEKILREALAQEEQILTDILSK